MVLKNTINTNLLIKYFHEDFLDPITQYLYQLVEFVKKNKTYFDIPRNLKTFVDLK